MAVFTSPARNRISERERIFRCGGGREREGGERGRGRQTGGQTEGEGWLGSLGTVFQGGGKRWRLVWIER